MRALPWQVAGQSGPECGQSGESVQPSRSGASGDPGGGGGLELFSMQILLHFSVKCGRASEFTR